MIRSNIPDYMIAAMQNVMKYRGYRARIDFDATDNLLVGRLLGMTEAIVFHGASVEELRADFEFAVHSTIESPELVSRVTPPTTTMANTMAQQINNQIAIGFCIDVKIISEV